LTEGCFCFHKQENTDLHKTCQVLNIVFHPRNTIFLPTENDEEPHNNNYQKGGIHAKRLGL
jgi:hypothetical protein